MSEVIESTKQTDEFEHGERRYIFDGNMKIAVKVFGYHDIKAVCCCKLPERFCSSKSTVNIQKNVKFCFMWSVLV